MKARSPRSIEPTGAPNPFDKQNITESTGRARSATDSPSAAAALKMRAPQGARAPSRARGPSPLSLALEHCSAARLSRILSAINPVARRRISAQWSADSSRVPGENAAPSRLRPDAGACPRWRTSPHLVVKMWPTLFADDFHAGRVCSCAIWFPSSRRTKMAASFSKIPPRVPATVVGRASPYRHRPLTSAIARRMGLGLVTYPCVDRLSSEYVS